MERSDFFKGLMKFWWIPLITGLAFIGFGAWLICDPSPSIKIMSYIFAGCIGALGIFNLIYGFCNSDSYGGYGWAMAGGIIEILLCFFLFYAPEISLEWVFTYGVAVYILFMAVYSFVESYMISRYHSGLFWLLLLFLLGSLVFSMIFILGSGAGVVGGGWVYLGIAFISYGIYRALFSCKMHKINQLMKNDAE